MNSQNPAPGPDRRGFFKKVLAIVIGGIAGLAPAFAGLMALVDPLRHKAAAGRAR